MTIISHLKQQFCGSFEVHDQEVKNPPRLTRPGLLVPFPVWVQGFKYSIVDRIFVKTLYLCAVISNYQETLRFFFDKFVTLESIFSTKSVKMQLYLQVSEL